MGDQDGGSPRTPDEPWWYSGPPSGGAEPPPASDREDHEPGAIDWMGMLAGAARMVDWARGAVLDPHSDHADPREHPDCMICRTLVVVGDQVGMTPGGDGPSSAPDPTEAPQPDPIRWIPLHDR